MEEYNNLFEQLNNKESARQFYEFNDNVQKFYLISKKEIIDFLLGWRIQIFLYIIKVAVRKYLRDDK